MLTRFTKLISAMAFAATLFVINTNHAHAAACVPGTGMATVTNSSFSTKQAGANDIWVRVQSASPLAVKLRVEVTAGGTSTPTCFEVSNPTPTSSTAWSWVKAGSITMPQTGNTLKLVGVDPGMRVDRAIAVPQALLINGQPCTPSNTRNASASPAVEPGDNCLVAPTTTIVSTQPPATGDTAAPTNPTNFKASNITSNQLTLTWSPATDNVAVTNYTVTTGTRTVYSGTALTATDLNLNPNTAYSYKIVAKDAAGNTSSGVTVSATTQPAPTTPPSPTTQVPATPTGLTRNLVFDYGRFGYYMELKWAASIGATSYTVTRNDAPLGTTTTTSIRDNNPVVGNYYTYKVSAQNTAGTSAPAVTTTVGRCFLIWCWAE